MATPNARNLQASLDELLYPNRTLGTAANPPDAKRGADNTSSAGAALDTVAGATGVVTTPLTQSLRAGASAVDYARGALTPEGSRLTNPNAVTDALTGTSLMQALEGSRNRLFNNASDAFGRIIGYEPVPTPGVSTSAAQPGAAVPQPTLPTPQPGGRQTSFTNADITPELAGRTNVVPAGAFSLLGTGRGLSDQINADRAQSPDTLAGLLAQLAPPAPRATLIRHTPTQRMARGPAEEARRRKERALDIAEAGQQQQADATAAGQRQEGIATAANIVGQLQQRRQELTQALAVQQARSNVLTPEGRKSLAEARRIELALQLIGIKTAAGDINTDQTLAYLTGQQADYTPVTGLAGDTVGTLNTRSGAIRPLDPAIAELLSPTPRR